MSISSNILIIYRKIFKLITYIFLILLTNNNFCYCNNYDNEFNFRLNKYIKLAERISSKKQITKQDVKKLLNNSLNVLNHIKFNNLYKKFNNIEEIIFKQVKVLNYNNKFEENIIKFTMSFFYIFTTLKKKHIENIISKSPLELVPLLMEMNIFTKFITANASYYGCNNFSICNGKRCEIKISKDAIMKIMGKLIITYLINSNINKVYKLSNTSSAFYNASYLYNQKQQTNENARYYSENLYKNVINKIQKNINNDERILISINIKNN